MYTLKTMNPALMKIRDDKYSSDEEKIIRDIQQLLTKNRHGMTISEISRNLGINRTLILNVLNLMVGQGEISMRSFGRAKVYTLSSKIPIARLLSLSSDLFLVVDEELFIEDLNDAFASFFKMNSDVIKGTNIIYSPIPHFFSHDIIQALQDASSGTKRIFEDYVGFEGNEYFFRISCIPIQESDFSTKVALVLHDLTLHKKYEEELERQLNARTSELSSSIRRYEVLAEVAPVGIFETDVQGKVIYVNKKWCEITGNDSDEVMGSKWMKSIHRDDREWIKKLWYEHVSEQIPWNHPIRYQKKNGEEVHTLGMAVPLRTDNGEVTGYLGTIVDITERVAAEQIIQNLNEYLTTVLENANDGVATLDIERKFTSCNAAGCKILGYERSDLLGQSIRKLYESDDEFKNNGKEIYLELSQTGHYRGEVNIVRGDGKNRIVEVSISEMKNNGTITGIIILFRDVTESIRVKNEALIQEQRLKTILDGLVDAVCVIDRHGNILYANACASRYLSGSDVLNGEKHQLSEYIPKNELNSLRSYYQKIIDSQIPDSKIICLTIREQNICFLNRAVPIRFGEHSVDAVLSLSLDTRILEHE